MLRQARELVGDTPNVTLHDVPTNDVWARDHGAMFLSGASDLPPALVDWEYNAWGGKYPPFDLDNRIPSYQAQVTGRRRFSPGIILEGGAVDGDGQGTVLTTEPCLLNPNRNPQLGQADVEQYLADYCGARKVLWLAGEVAGDDTDGHIDELARFVAPATVLAAVETDQADVNFAPLADNVARLRSMTDAQGRALEVIPVRLPKPRYYDDQRLPASYMNFYIANGVVVAAAAALARSLPRHPGEGWGEGGVNLARFSSDTVNRCAAPGTLIRPEAANLAGGRQPNTAFRGSQFGVACQWTNRCRVQRGPGCFSPLSGRVARRRCECGCRPGRAC